MRAVDMKKTKRLTLSALCTALGVVVLYLVSMIEVLDMTAAMIASILVFFCVLEIGYGYAGAVYLSVTLFSLILLPNKSSAVMFAGIFGYMPITKFFFEKKMKKLAWIPKILIFNLFFGAIMWFGMELLGFTPENTFGIPPYVYTIVYLVLANAVCILLDILYGRLSRVYFYKYRDKIRKYLR